MKNEWDDFAKDWDSYEDARVYSASAFECLSNIVKISNTNVIDFGCGTGLLTEKIITLAKSVIAIDSSKRMIDVLKNKNLPGVQAISDELSLESIAENSLKESSIDIVVASSVFGFIPNYESIIELLKSLLVNQGYIIQWDWLSSEDNPDFGLSQNTVTTVLKNCGAILKKLRYYWI